MAQAPPRGEAYSTLEVSHAYDTQTQKEVAPSYGDDFPQAVHPGHIPKPYYDYQSDALTPSTNPETQKERRTRFGLAPKTFWIIVAAVSLGIVAAVVGGAVGGTLSNRKSSEPAAQPTASAVPGGDAPPPDPVTNGTVRLLDSSKVAAVNWTDGNSFSHYAVYSQDSTNSLMVSLWDSQNQTWTAVNISNAFLLAGTPIEAKAGTPLAAVSTGPPYWPFQMDLYYLTPSNNIREVYTRDMDGRRWGVGDLGKTPKTADEDSALASVWHRCGSGCSQLIYVVYVSNGRIQLLNGSDWTQTTPLVDVDSGSPLALFPFTDFDASNPNNPTDKPKYPTDNRELRLDYQDGGTLNELKYSFANGWMGGHVLAENLPTNPPPQIAAAPFGNWFNAQVTLLNKGGSLSGRWWDNSSAAWYETENMAIKGGPTAGGFQAIAQHHERRLYAVVNGTIQEYRWEAKDPFTFISVGKVTLATDLVKP